MYYVEIEGELKRELLKDKLKKSLWEGETELKIALDLNIKMDSKRTEFGLSLVKSIQYFNNKLVASRRFVVFCFSLLSYLSHHDQEREVYFE